MSADYSQIEMRVLAHLCQDSVLLGLFRHSEGYDIYRHLAARIFKKAVTEVAEDERTKAKVICLGKCEELVFVVVFLVYPLPLFRSFWYPGLKPFLVPSR